MVRWSPMSRVDRATRAFWRVAGRPVDLSGSERWLASPTNHGQLVGDGWLRDAAVALGGSVRGDEIDAGLIPDLSCLDGPSFSASATSPSARHFYEHTSRWQMEAWTRWSPVFKPGGSLVSRFLGRRVQQLAIPTRPLDAALGMDSRVVPLVDAAGQQQAAGWIRTLRPRSQPRFESAPPRDLPGVRQRPRCPAHRPRAAVVVGERGAPALPADARDVTWSG